MAQAGSGEAAAELLGCQRSDVLITDLGLAGLGLARLALGLVFATAEDGVGEALPVPLGRAMLLRRPYDETSLLAAVWAAAGRPEGEGQGAALDPLGPSRLGVLRKTAPNPDS